MESAGFFPQTPLVMWPFTTRQTSEDDQKRLARLEEKVESLSRRMESLVQDVDEFFAKINKARQRVNKEDRDASAGAAGAVGLGSSAVRPLSRAELKAQAIHRMRGA